MTSTAPLIESISHSCLGCGKKPEVYGSSWCASCHDSIPHFAQMKMIALRNALLDLVAVRERNLRRLSRRAWRNPETS